jgi:hypothetical protein
VIFGSQTVRQISLRRRDVNALVDGPASGSVSGVDEHQFNLNFHAPYSAAPPVTAELRDEIALAFGLPLGRRVEVCFRGSQRAAVTGILELLSTPDFPWEPRQTLRLHIAGLEFSSREIERWTIL